jgi:DNA-binding MarR family transcriptional regulator
MMSSAPTNGDDGPFVGSRLRLVWQWVRAQIDEATRAAGYDDLNRAHINLCRYPGIEGRRPTEIAEDLQITKQSVNDLLAHMEDRGYMTREVDPADSRARIVRLTRKGKKLERTIFVAARDAEIQVADMLGAARFKQFRRSLDELVQLTSGERTGSDSGARG